MQLAIPNLPGTMRASDSWIHLQQFGFKKGGKTVESPNRYLSTVAFGENQAEGIEEPKKERARPSTAGASLGRSSTNLNGLNNSDRVESTINVLNYNMPGITGMAQSGSRQILQRPKTASAALGKTFSSAEIPKCLLGPAGMEARTQSTPYIPKFVENDKLVARFHAHFMQPRVWDDESPIGNPTIETQIARRLTVLYYITDDTIEIIEEKTQNSGFQGGNFFKRGKLNQSNGKPVSLRDLAVGNMIQCMGVELYITDADPFTREYFRRELRLILGPALPRPDPVREDLGAQYATGLGVKGPAKDRRSFGTCSTDYLAKKGGLEKTYQFLKYEGKILTFFCYEVPKFDPFSDKPPVTPDTFVPSNSMRKYVLLFYLSDNKIEVRALKGCGEEGKILLKKNKLPMNWREVQRGANPIFYEPSNFSCGTTIDIYGRMFLLVSCDDFTRQMLEEMGIEQFEVPVIEEVHDTIKHPIPMLGDGFLPIGSPEDTLATVYGMPKAKQSTKTVLKNQNRLLRARVRQLTHSKIDASRSFQLSFFLEDNTLQIFEEVRRNSGIVGGNFLKRGRYTNNVPPGGGEPRYFKPTDVFLGNIISLNGLEFQIIEMDNMSLLFCEAFPEEFPMFDTFYIVHTLVQKAITNGIDLRKEFAAFDANHSGSVERDQFVQVLDKINLSRHLNDQELLTLVRRFKEGDRYFYIEMADLFSHMFFLNNVRSHRTTIPEDIVDLSSLFVTARSRSTQWRRVLRKDPLAANGKVRLNHLLHVFRKHGLIVPAHLRVALFHRFGLRGASSIAASKVLMERAEHSRGVHVQHQPSRPDLRSRARAEMTGSNSSVIEDESLEYEQKKSKRRDSFSKVSSIMRAYDKGKGKRAEVHDETDESQWIVDYMAMCDEIYVCDWIRPGQA